MRTVCELVLNQQYYVHPEIVSFIGGFIDDGLVRDKPSTPRLQATSASYGRALSLEDSNVLISTFQLDCIETTKNNTYCNMWHIYALSSVLRSPIRSIYPDCNRYIRPLLNKIVQPRIEPTNTRALLHVMWTRTTPMTPKQWTPNHFVPCVFIDDNDVRNGSATKPQRVSPQAAVIKHETLGPKPKTIHSDLKSFVHIPDIATLLGQRKVAQQNQKSILHFTKHTLSSPAFTSTAFSSPSEAATLSSTENGMTLCSNPAAALLSTCSTVCILTPASFTPSAATTPTPTNSFSSSTGSTVPTSVENDGSIAFLSPSPSATPSSSVSVVTPKQSPAFTIPSAIPTPLVIPSVCNLLSISKRTSRKSYNTPNLMSVMIKQSSTKESTDNTSPVNNSHSKRFKASHSDSDTSDQDQSDSYTSDSDIHKLIMSDTVLSDSDTSKGNTYSTSMQIKEIQQLPCTDLQLLPFPHFSHSWYGKEQKFYRDVKRDNIRRTKKVEKNDRGELILLNRSQVRGTLEENLQELQNSLIKFPSTSQKNSHYSAIYHTGKYIIDNGSFVKTQEAGAIYATFKGIKPKKYSCEYYEIFCQHLNLILVYIIILHTSYQTIKVIWKNLSIRLRILLTNEKLCTNA